MKEFARFPLPHTPHHPNVLYAFIEHTQRERDIEPWRPGKKNKIKRIVLRGSPAEEKNKPVAAVVVTASGGREKNENIKYTHAHAPTETEAADAGTPPSKCNNLAPSSPACGPGGGAGGGAHLVGIKFDSTRPATT